MELTDRSPWVQSSESTLTLSAASLVCGLLGLIPLVLLPIWILSGIPLPIVGVLDDVQFYMVEASSVTLGVIALTFGSIVLENMRRALTAKPIGQGIALVGAILGVLTIFLAIVYGMIVISLSDIRL